MDCIILLGIKHCGKSTQGRLLSERLKLPFYDTDLVLEEREGCTARGLYTARGAEAFRAAEAAACRSVAERVRASGGDAVIATGGGICTNPAALEVLHPLGTFVFLVASEKTAADRIVREARLEQGDDGQPRLSAIPAYIAKKDPHSLEDVRAIFHEFYEERVKLYASLADVSIQMGDAPRQANAQRILALLRRA